MNKVKVAIDTGPLTSGHKVRGIGFHTKLLVEHLKKMEEVEVETKDLSKDDTSGFDILHYPSFHPYFFSIPFKKRGKTVLTIHDLIYLIYPNKYPAGIKGKVRFFIQKLFLRNVDEIITISETSKKDIVRFLPVTKEKVSVIYLAPREGFKKLDSGDWKDKIVKKYKLPEKFVLYVGDVNYNKNVLGLISACKLAKLPLVIVGKQAASGDFDQNHPENKSLVRIIKKYGQDKDVIRAGFVSDEDLVKIYNLASVYCQPSFYEGFGLPVLEAMACETPVVCARTQALVEIAGSAAAYADPKNVKSIADKLTKVMENKRLRNELVEKGRKRAKKFFWDKTAKETAEVYKKTVKFN